MVFDECIADEMNLYAICLSVMLSGVYSGVRHLLKTIAPHQLFRADALHFSHLTCSPTLDI